MHIKDKQEVLTLNAPLTGTVMSSVQSTLPDTIYQKMVQIKNSEQLSGRVSLEADIQKEEVLKNRLLTSLMQDARGDSAMVNELSPYLMAEERWEELIQLKASLPMPVIDTAYADLIIDSLDLILPLLEGSAYAILDSLPETNETERSFKLLQRQGLAVKQADYQLSLSEEEDSMLYQLAESQSSMSARAQAILAWTNDEIFHPKISADTTTAASSRAAKRDIVNNEQPANTFSIYPNPADDYILIQRSRPDKKANVFVYDLKGQLLKTTELMPEQLSSKVLTGNLQTGLYFIMVKEEGLPVLRQKLMINH